MVNEVLLDNQAGWDLDALQAFRTFDGVLRINGEDLLPSGRFRFARIFFASEEEAGRFAQASAQTVAGRKRAG